MLLSRGVELSREIRPYVVVYLGSNGMDPKSNENRRKTKTSPVEKDNEGSFEVEMFEELWFKNKKEGNMKPTLKFVVWNRHIGDSSTSGKDSEGLYEAEIKKFDEWLANGLYLGRVPLRRYGSSSSEGNVANSYIQVSIEMKYNKETNVYRANLHRATSSTNRLSRRTSGSIGETPHAAPCATNSDGTSDNCQYLVGYNNEKDMFKGCNVLIKRVIEGREVDFEGVIGEYVVDANGWNVSWKGRHDGTPLPPNITKDDLLKDDEYKVYRSNKSNKDVLNTYQFFRKVERDDMYNRKNESNAE